jgi:hypothetical protein
LFLHNSSQWSHWPFAREVLSHTLHARHLSWSVPKKVVCRDCHVGDEIEYRFGEHQVTLEEDRIKKFGISSLRCR